MERLTNEYWRNFDPWECCGQDKYCNRGCHDQGGCTNGCIVPKLYVRLAAYEDTGLEPGEVAKVRDAYSSIAGKGVSGSRIHELIRAEREGRLVVLPCKVGETVWALEVDKYGVPVDCAGWILIGGNRGFAFLSPILGETDNAQEICYEYYDRSMEYDELPIAVVPWKQLYMTREEAEAALEAMKGENHETDL